jgi:hypothetical protein
MVEATTAAEQASIRATGGNLGGRLRVKWTALFADDLCFREHCDIRIPNADGRTWSPSVLHLKTQTR